MTDTVYLVLRHGVYIRGVVAVCTTREKAEKAVEFAKGLERDNYHDFEIHEVVLDRSLVNPDGPHAELTIDRATNDIIPTGKTYYRAVYDIE